MKKVYQTRYGFEGNCFQACIASILELSLKEVPDFSNLYDPEKIPEECNKWLKSKGLGIIELNTPNQKIDVFKTVCKYNGFYIASLGDEGLLFGHAVIVKGKIIFHDPENKNKNGLKNIQAYRSYFIVINEIKKFSNWILKKR
jgi:hypothetical protein